MLRSVTARSRQISVGVVGAGFAGLRCADVLLQHGCKVTILEARNRIGGRVAQSNHLGHLVDLGPNWIHGTDDNPIMNIARETGTKLHAWDEDSWIYDSDGKVLSSEENDLYNAAFWDDGVIADAFRHSNEQQDSIDPHVSLYDFFAEKAAKMWTNEPNNVASRRRTMFLRFTFMWSFYIGSPVTRQSLKYFWLEECIEGENPFVAETYSKILEAIAAPAQENADIRLNTEVVSIVSDDTELPRIKTANGPELSFDEVVVTTPLGWLKHNKDAFQPPLPSRLSAAIDNISYGTLDKVYITFPRPFWTINQSEKKLLPTGGIDPERKTPNTTATTAPLHQPPKDAISDDFPGFIHWLEPHYAPDKNPQRWMQEGMNLSALTPDCNHPTLLFYIQGPQSHHIGDMIKSSTTDAERDARLKDFFEPYYSRLPNYNTANPDCTPTAVLATAWVNDKFAGYGSYANFQVGLEKGDEDIEVMRHGMPERRVWLAGEHTAPFIACGTSTGAYWSGEAVAKRIVDAYGLGSV